MTSLSAFKALDNLSYTNGIVSPTVGVLADESEHDSEDRICLSIFKSELEVISYRYWKGFGMQ